MALTYPKNKAPATGSINRNISDRLNDLIFLKDFGAIGDGVTDDTSAIQLAINHAQSTNTKIFGSSGSSYKITSKLSITSSNVFFDGNGCRFLNYIQNVTAADPLFEISGTSTKNIGLSNFSVTGTVNNGNVFSIISSLGFPPQNVSFQNISVNQNSGFGKTSAGVAMNSQSFYVKGGLDIRILECNILQSGGCFFDATQKIHLTGSTFEGVPLGNIVYALASNDLVIDGACSFVGGTMTNDLIAIISCKGIIVNGNKFKGGGNLAHHFNASGINSGLIFEGNQLEVWALTQNAIEVTTATSSPRIIGNELQFINDTGSLKTFLGAGIHITSESGYIGYSPVIESNTFSINNYNVTITNMIALGTVTDSIVGPIIRNNSLMGRPSGTVYTITNGINLYGTMIGAEVSRNQYGAPSGVTGIFTNGIVIGSGCTGTKLLENFNIGNTTNAIVNNGIRTERVENGKAIAISFTPVIIGGTTAGTGTYTKQYGTYIIQNGFIKFDINIIWTAHSGTGYLAVTTPFTAVGATELQIFNVLSANYTFTGQLTAGIIAGGSNIFLYSNISNTSFTSAQMDPTGNLYISGYMEVA
jgi:hypothetical protein